MNVPECQQHFSHCRSLVIIPDAQGQLTSQSQEILFTDKSRIDLRLYDGHLLVYIRQGEHGVEHGRFGIGSV